MGNNWDRADVGVVLFLLVFIGGLCGAILSLNMAILDRLEQDRPAPLVTEKR